MDVNKTISELMRFTQRFGVLKGPYLFMKLKGGSQQNIQIKGIRHPFSMRKGSSDYDTFYQAIVHQHYKFNYKINPAVIVDGGANIGLATLALKNLYPLAKIICIEPDPQNYVQLLKNIAPYQNVSAVNAGLWHKEAHLKISDKYNMGKWGMVTEEVDEQAEDTISTITVDQLMTKFSLERIDILKLDIETAERELFSANYNNWLPRVKMIIIELHDLMSKGTAKPFFKAVNETFENYTFFQLGENTIIVNEDMETPA